MYRILGSPHVLTTQQAHLLLKHKRLPCSLHISSMLAVRVASWWHKAPTPFCNLSPTGAALLTTADLIHYCEARHPAFPLIPPLSHITLRVANAYLQLYAQWFLALLGGYFRWLHNGGSPESIEAHASFFIMAPVSIGALGLGRAAKARMKEDLAQFGLTPESEPYLLDHFARFCSALNSHLSKHKYVLGTARPMLADVLIAAAFETHFYVDDPPKSWLIPEEDDPLARAMAAGAVAKQGVTERVESEADGGDAGASRGGGRRKYAQQKRLVSNLAKAGEAAGAAGKSSTSSGPSNTGHIPISVVSEQSAATPSLSRSSSKLGSAEKGEANEPAPSSAPTPPIMAAQPETYKHIKAWMERMRQPDVELGSFELSNNAGWFGNPTTDDVTPATLEPLLGLVVEILPWLATQCDAFRLWLSAQGPPEGMIDVPTTGMDWNALRAAGGRGKGMTPLEASDATTSLAASRDDVAVERLAAHRVPRLLDQQWAMVVDDSTIPCKVSMPHISLAYTFTHTCASKEAMAALAARTPSVRSDVLPLSAIAELQELAARCHIGEGVHVAAIPSQGWDREFAVWSPHHQAS